MKDPEFDVVILCSCDRHWMDHPDNRLDFGKRCQRIGLGKLIWLSGVWHNQRLAASPEVRLQVEPSYRELVRGIAGVFGVGGAGLSPRPLCWFYPHYRMPVGDPAILVDRPREHGLADACTVDS